MTILPPEPNLPEILWKIMFPDTPFPKSPPDPDGDPFPWPHGGVILNNNEEEPPTYPVRTTHTHYPSPDVPMPAEGGGVLGTIFSVLIQVGTMVGSYYLAKKLMEKMQVQSVPQVIYVNEGNRQMVTHSENPALEQQAKKFDMQARMDLLLETAQEELQKAMEANHQAAQGNTGAMRAIAEQAKQYPAPQPSAPQYQTLEVYTPPTATGVGFPNPLDPSKTGGNRPFIEEDQAWIQRNLAHAARPMTPEEMAQAQQQMRMSQQQQALAQQQTRALREQEELARAQRLAIQREQWAKSQIPLGEKLRGPKTDYPRIVVKSWPWEKAYEHWFHGQGQPIEVPFRSLHFKDGYFHSESEIKQTAIALLDQARFNKHIITKEIDFKNQPFEFGLSNISDYSTYGNIRIDIKGTLTADPKGNWQFDGKVYPGYGYILQGKPLRGDVFEFDPSSHRNLPAEVATRIMHTLPGTRYIIYFQQEHVPVTLRFIDRMEGEYK